MAQEQAGKIRGRIFDGYLTFQYWDEGFGTFEVCSVGRFQTVCSVTMDDTRTWRSAKVRIYPSNTDWNSKMEHGADLMFIGDVKVKEIAAEFDIYIKV